MSNIRIGIFGLKRESAFIHHFLANNADVVAVCDKNPQKLNMISEKLGASVGTYLDFDDFIEHPMDAVFIANYFHEHTPFAIKCLEKTSMCFASALPTALWQRVWRWFVPPKKVKHFLCLPKTIRL